MKALVIVIALAVAAVRPALLFVELPEHVQSSYEAIAHILVGGLFAAWFVGRDRTLLRIAIGISIVEGVCAGLNLLFI